MESAQTSWSLLTLAVHGIPRSLHAEQSPHSLASRFLNIEISVEQLKLDFKYYGQLAM